MTCLRRFSNTKTNQYTMMFSLKRVTAIYIFLCLQVAILPLIVSGQRRCISPRFACKFNYECCSNKCRRQRCRPPAPTSAPTTTPTSVPTQTPTLGDTAQPTGVPVTLIPPTLEPTDRPTPSPTCRGYFGSCRKPDNCCSGVCRNRRCRIFGR